MERDEKLEQQLNTAFISGQSSGAEILSKKFMEKATFEFSQGRDKAANFYREISKDCMFYSEEFKKPPIPKES